MKSKAKREMEMVDVKGKGKRRLCLVLACFLCWTGSAQVSAEVISSENPEQKSSDSVSDNCAAGLGEGMEDLNDAGIGVVVESVDVSSMVYQAGGLGTPAKENYGIALYNTLAEDRIKGEILQALLEEESWLDVSAYEMILEEIRILFAEVLNENTELFYVSPQLKYINGEKGVTKLYFSYYASAPKRRLRYADKLAEAISLVEDTMSEREKALVLHDYLIQHCAYAKQELQDYTFLVNNDIFSAYGALVTGKAVCQGYAAAYYQLLCEAGIPSILCHSDSMQHAWNLVLIDGSWYHVDTTWDDPTWNTEGKVCHEYFLLSDTEMRARNHRDWVATRGETMVCDSTKYDDYWWREVDSQIVRVAPQDYIYVKDNGWRFQLVRRKSEAETVLYNNNATAYAFLSRQGNYVYFNDRSNVYSLSLDDLTDAVPKVEYTYDKNDGYIYGAMVYEDGKIRLNIRQSPSNGTDNYIEAGEIAVPPAYCIFGRVDWVVNWIVPTIVELIDAQGRVTAKRFITDSTEGYRLKNISAGTYTLQVSKQDHVTSKYKIIVMDTDVKLDTKVQLLGDVNGDGTINARDKKMLFNHIEKISELTEYLFEVGDVNGDGTINARDKKLLYNHIEKITLLW